MAPRDRTWDRADHRHFALQFMPPGEFRDEYLRYLEDVGHQAPEASTPALAEPAGRPWTARRYVIAALGAIGFACGTWLVSTLL